MPSDARRSPARTARSTDGAADLPNPGHPPAPEPSRCGEPRVHAGALHPRSQPSPAQSMPPDAHRSPARTAPSTDGAADLPNPGHPPAPEPSRCGEPRVHAGSLHPRSPPSPAQSMPSDARCSPARTARSTDGAADLPNPGHPPAPEPGRCGEPRVLAGSLHPRSQPSPAQSMPPDAHRSPARTARSTDGAADLPNPGPRTAPRTYPTPVHGRRRGPTQPRSTDGAADLPNPGPRTAPRTYPTPAIRRRRNQVGAASPASTRGRCTRDPRHHPRNSRRRTPAARPREPLGPRTAPRTYPTPAIRRRRSQVGAASPRVHAGSLHPRSPPSPAQSMPSDARRSPARTARSTDGAADLPNPGHPPAPEPSRCGEPRVHAGALHPRSQPSPAQFTPPDARCSPTPGHCRIRLGLLEPPPFARAADESCLDGIAADIQLDPLVLRQRT